MKWVELVFVSALFSHKARGERERDGRERKREMGEGGRERLLGRECVLYGHSFVSHSSFAANHWSTINFSDGKEKVKQCNEYVCFSPYPFTIANTYFSVMISMHFHYLKIILSPFILPQLEACQYTIDFLN
uniref:Uncharacterized protein n=1 Tax=Daucus carota subsp. sativus TaxID=79200 RepID=A0A175YJK1_DAUCS